MADPAADELRFLARHLRQAGSRDVLAELRRGLKDAAGPAADAARGSILSVPAKHPEGTLRTGIAGTVKVNTSLGASTARVTITATGPARWPGAAVKIEGDAWWHPVFGRAEHEAESQRLQRIHGKGHGHGRGWTWVRQQSPRPGWFIDAVGSRQAGFDKAVDDVAERIERRLAGEA